MGEEKYGVIIKAHITILNIGVNGIKFEIIELKNKFSWAGDYFQKFENRVVKSGTLENSTDFQIIEFMGKKNEGKYVIIPNPVNETFIVQGPSDDNSQFSLYDSQNKLVQKNMLINSIYDINSYKSGVYYIKIESSSRVQFLKFVKLCDLF
jgi:hypothetical protein